MHQSSFQWVHLSCTPIIDRMPRPTPRFILESWKRLYALMDFLTWICHAGNRGDTSPDKMMWFGRTVNLRLTLNISSSVEIEMGDLGHICFSDYYVLCIIAYYYYVLRITYYVYVDLVVLRKIEIVDIVLYVWVAYPLFVTTITTAGCVKKFSQV